MYQLLSGLRVVIDCANGAAYRAAPEVLWELGAEVIPIGVAPNGTNINDACGSTAPMLLQETVVASGADIGIALDGDADRLIIVDEQGRIVDGDQIMALIGSSWAKRGALTGGGVVATVMSNLGLERFLQSQGLTLERTKVGDRYVLERMRAGGAGIPGFYTKTGVGTQVADGKEVKSFDGQDYILERGIFADLAIVKAWKADESGNLVFRKTARNFNLPAATCGKVCVVEVEEIIPVGSLDPDSIHLPGVYVQRMIVGAPYDKKIEFRTVRQKEAA